MWYGQEINEFWAMTQNFIDNFHNPHVFWKYALCTMTQALKKSALGILQKKYLAPSLKNIYLFTPA